MLPKAQRLSNSIEIREVIRRGVVVRTPNVIAHAQINPGQGIRFGYITGKRIGGAVVRNRTKRRFRELTKALITQPVGNEHRIEVMWRLQPGSATATTAQLERNIERVWHKILERVRA